MAVFALTRFLLLFSHPSPWGWVEKQKKLKHVPFSTVIPNSHRPLPVVKLFELH